MGHLQLTWMDTAMHDLGCLGHTLQIDLPAGWANLALYRDVWRGGLVSRCWGASNVEVQFQFFLPFFLPFPFCMFAVGGRDQASSFACSSLEACSLE